MTEISLAQEQQNHNRVTVSRVAEKNSDTKEIMGQPGILEYLPVCQLFIDPEYQRAADRKQIKKIADNWDWRKVKCVNVAMRPDTPSLYAVYDGQHTVLAARRRNITQIPCYIIDADSVKEEAAGFVGINRDRKAVTLATQFKAMVMADDPRANKIIALLNKHGFFVSDGKTTKARHTSAIGALFTVLTEGPLLDNTLEVISLAWQGECPSLQSSFIRGLASFLHRTERLTSKEEIVKSLSRFSADAIQQRASLLAKAKSTSATDVWREVFLDCYNHGKRKENRLSLDVVED